jgi:hypothetical protein
VDLSNAIIPSLNNDARFFLFFFIVALRHARKIKSVGAGYRDLQRDDFQILSEIRNEKYRPTCLSYADLSVLAWGLGIY